MLTEELLRGVEGLTPEQISSITTLSKNDEEQVIGSKIGEIHASYEKDVLGITGVEKNKGEKAYDYVKRSLTDYKTNADTHKSALDTLKAEHAELLAKSKEGGDKALLQQIQDAADKVKALELSNETAKQEFETEKQGLLNQVRDIKLNSAFDAVTSKLKFKSDYNNEAIQRNVKAAKLELLSTYTPEFTENGNLQFRDKDGELVRDKANSLNPSTLDKLLGKSLEFMVSTTPPAGGAGGKGAGATKKSIADLAGAKTQSEAGDIIKAHLLAQGLTTDSPAYHEKLTEIRTENKISELPIA